MVAVTSCAAPRVGHKQTAKERMLSTINCGALALMLPTSSMFSGNLQSSSIVIP